MTVTRVRIDELRPSHSSVCAVCTVVLSNELAIHQMKVVKGKNGLFVTFPNQGADKSDNGKTKYNDIVHPTNDKLRLEIVEEVLKAYREEQAKVSQVS